MVDDAKRAIAWMKAQGPAYGVNPQRVVVGGGSAGGHLGLLAAYTPTEAALTPPDVQGHDLSVRAVISCYGPTDLRAYYEYTRQDRWARPDQLQRRARTSRATSQLPRLTAGRGFESPV
jgi:acetyl esterase/lipase